MSKNEVHRSARCLYLIGVSCVWHGTSLSSNDADTGLSRVVGSSRDGYTNVRDHWHDIDVIGYQQMWFAVGKQPMAFNILMVSYLSSMLPDAHGQVRGDRWHCQ